ncbi:DUF3617 domain-containing protein [Acidithiobacillus sp. IBUN Pt1247-S3]|uniref:DUF3617 domain-containing protein n=1 Tax=Acidithiobacillus sp. IBUN Pt1247-S3 TaxID=3166642 RepID=UPI0034E4AC4C
MRFPNLLPLLACALTFATTPAFAAPLLQPGQWHETAHMSTGMTDQIEFCIHQADPFAQFLHSQPGSTCRRTGMQQLGPRVIQLEEECVGTSSPMRVQMQITLHTAPDGRSYQGTVHGTVHVAGETVPLQETLKGNYQGACH